MLKIISRIRHYDVLFYQAAIHLSHPEPSIHVAHSDGYIHYYIWSSYPSPKNEKIYFSELFSFDLPSASLFFCYLFGAVILMKLFAYFGSKLCLDTVSVEPVSIPTR